MAGGEGSIGGPEATARIRGRLEGLPGKEHG